MTALLLLLQPPLPLPRIDFGLGWTEAPGDVAVSLQILLVLTVLTVAPAILVLMTSFTRIVIVLSFVRNALATNQMPPNQVLVGLAVLLTFFVMAPTFSTIYEDAFLPYMEEALAAEDALATAEASLREFMFRYTREKDLAMLLSAADHEQPETRDDVALSALVPAFVISELKTAFQLGFVLFVPFLVVDMIVASTLMAMGMMMLPPVMISLPFKILLFVLVDGWHLVVRSLLMSYQ